MHLQGKRKFVYSCLIALFIHKNTNTKLCFTCRAMCDCQWLYWLKTHRVFSWSWIVILTQRRHGRILPSKTGCMQSNNFLTRLLYKNLYWHITYSAVSYSPIRADFILSYIVIYFVFILYFFSETFVLRCVLPSFNKPILIGWLIDYRALQVLISISSWTLVLTLKSW